MPHIVVEYSGNLKGAVSWPQVLKQLHRAAAEMAELPESGLRTRAHSCEDFLVADGGTRNAFVHMVLRMGHGRSDDAKQRIGDHLFAVLCESFSEVYGNGPVSISLEIQEIHPIFNYRKSNLRAHTAKVA
jgi:5-carboxymethyl-2-hydroxymuconate isomerase